MHTAHIATLDARARMRVRVRAHPLGEGLPGVFELLALRVEHEDVDDPDEVAARSAAKGAGLGIGDYMPVGPN